MTGLIGPVALLALYAWGVARAQRPWPVRRTIAFAGGCFLVAAALAGPIESGSDRNLATHMLQHLLVGVAAPGLLALGAPIRLALAALPHHGRRALGRWLHHPVVRAFAHPAVATLLASATLVLVHLTGAFEAAATSPTLHALEHAVLFWTGLIAWMAILGVDPLPHTPDAVAALAWISVNMVAMTAVGAILSTATTPRYAHYPSLALQRDAGTVMWLGGAAILVPAAIAVSMWALHREEVRQRRRDAIGDALAAGGAE